MAENVDYSSGEPSGILKKCFIKSYIDICKECVSK